MATEGQEVRGDGEQAESAGEKVTSFVLSAATKAFRMYRTAPAARADFMKLTSLQILGTHTAGEIGLHVDGCAYATITHVVFQKLGGYGAWVSTEDSAQGTHYTRFVSCLFQSCQTPDAYPETPTGGIALWINTSANHTELRHCVFSLNNWIDIQLGESGATNASSTVLYHCDLEGFKTASSPNPIVCHGQSLSLIGQCRFEDSLDAEGALFVGPNCDYIFAPDVHYGSGANTLKRWDFDASWEGAGKRVVHFYRDTDAAQAFSMAGAPLLVTRGAAGTVCWAQRCTSR